MYVDDQSKMDTATAAIQQLVDQKVDVVIGTSPHFFTVCGAYVASRIKRVPFVFELRDIWPESIKAVGAMKDSAVTRLLEKVEMFLYRKAACIVSVTASFKQVLDAELVARFGREGKFIAGYVGTHGMAHALETILDAADRVRQMGEGDIFRFIFLGNGARKQDLMAKAVAMQLANVIFIDTVAKGDVARYWSLLDVSIIHLKKAQLFTTVIPSKLFECMGMGIPILHGVAGESAAIVQREGVGLIFEPENARDLCDKLAILKGNSDVYQRLHSNCLAAAPRYDRIVLAGRMLDVLRETVAAGKSISSRCETA